MFQSIHHDSSDVRPFGIPACISVGIQVSPSTEGLNFLFERKKLINFTLLNKNFNSDNL
jgi:hypothetical protein